jgi:hypothetical protein
MALEIKIIDYGNWKAPTFGAIIQLICSNDDIAYSNMPVIETPAIVDTFIGSTFPNPYNPKNQALKLQYAYPIIKAGTYRYKFGLKAHNGKPGFDINNNEKIPAMYLNPNKKSKYYGKYFADHVDLHQAWNDTWRGSGACLTVMQNCWDRMLSYFSDGNTGNISIYRI